MSADEAGSRRSSPRRTKRLLSIEERTLWTGVTLSIKPLRTPPSGDEAAAAEPPVPAVRKPPGKMPARIKVTAVPPVAAKLQTPAAPPVALLSRKEKKRVARGASAIDGRLDLHGLTQAEAHRALFGFLMQAQALGAKLVLVITGKGGDRAGDDLYGGRGVLKRQVPLWLRLPEFHACVSGYEPAAIGHGGEGALYVRVRRGR